MKNIRSLSLRVITVLLFTVSLSTVLMAQPNPGPGQQGGGIGPTIDGPTVPFDGGMSLMLLASGIGYGAKRLRRKK